MLLHIFFRHPPISARAPQGVDVNIVLTGDASDGWGGETTVCSASRCIGCWMWLGTSWRRSRHGRFRTGVIDTIRRSLRRFRWPLRDFLLLALLLICCRNLTLHFNAAQRRAHAGHLTNLVAVLDDGSLVP